MPATGATSRKTSLSIPSIFKLEIRQLSVCKNLNKKGTKKNELKRTTWMNKYYITNKKKCCFWMISFVD